MKKVLLLSLLALGLGIVGCGKDKIKPETPAVEQQAPVTTEEMKGAKDSDAGNAYGLKTVNFEFNSFEITGSAKDVLAANAKILNGKSDLTVQVEGHCDERGSVQYNLALGEKRANAVKKYLVNLGIAEARVTLISYGKEKPVDQGHTEDSWAKNRRANFVVTSK